MQPTLPYWEETTRPLGLSFPCAFYDVRARETLDPHSVSCCNRGQADAVLKLIVQLQATWPAAWGPFTPADICVVTPSSAQTRLVRDVLRTNRDHRELSLDQVNVLPVTAVQGLQFRVVVVTTVFATVPKSSDRRRQQEAMLLTDWRTFNSAITRACSLLLVLGAQATCTGLRTAEKLFWPALLEICRQVLVHMLVIRTRAQSFFGCCAIMHYFKALCRVPSHTAHCALLVACG